MIIIVNNSPKTNSVCDGETEAFPGIVVVLCFSSENQYLFK